MNGWRRFAAVAAVFALTLQVLMPLGQAVPYSGAGSTNGYLLICTALGMKQIPDPDAPPKPDSSQTCPLCVSHAIGDHSMAAASVAVVPPAVPRTLSAAFSQDRHAGGHAPRRPSTRAPPVV